MHTEHWKISDMPWSHFEPSRLDPEILKLVKAAALVEHGGRQYGDYLVSVFAEDPDFQEAAKNWALEEVQHGDTLGRYAELADRNFHFKQAEARYRLGYQIDTEAMKAKRGSHAGELVARCMVEIGTSSYYTALADATDEPVLKTICQHIATDEFRHYNMFYTHLKRYVDRDHPSRFQRLRVALSRVLEAEDDELAFAYFAANAPNNERYDRKNSISEYMRRAYPLYTEANIQRSAALFFKACGFRPYSRTQQTISHLAWKLMQRKLAKLRQEAFSKPITSGDPLSKDL